MKPSKVLQFAAAQQAKGWRRLQILPTQPSLDPHQPPHYKVEVQGERGDGTVFSVTAVIGKSGFDLLHGHEALEAARKLLNGAVQQLLTFTGCGCKPGKSCPEHQGSQMVH